MKQFLSRPHPARRRVITTRHLASPVLGVGEAQIDRMLAQKNGGRREEAERKKKKEKREKDKNIVAKMPGCFLSRGKILLFQLRLMQPSCTEPPDATRVAAEVTGGAGIPAAR